ncbi:MAG: hypothetical protein WAL24_05495 [Nitrososphaeraceae archaeon]
MNKRSKVAVIVTMVAIVVGVGAFYLVSPLFISTQSFANSFESIVNETRLLDQDYQAQVKKWQGGELSNETMASVTDSYLPRFQELANRTNDLQTPAGYENVTTLYAKSLGSEMESYTHFRNYLLTGNTTESKASDQSLSDAFRFEMESFKAFKSASNATNN